MTPSSTQGADPSIDDSIWNTSQSRDGGLLASAVNEFVRAVQFVSKATSATAPYEKCGIIVEGNQEDPSDYAKGVTKDLVAVSGATTITNGNKTGRAWGLYAQSGIASGSDGLLVGAEIGLDNRGSDQPEFAKQTSKVVLALVAGEGTADQKPITAFGVMEAGTSSSHAGLIGNRDAFVDQDNAAVFGVRDTDGRIMSAMTANGGINVTRFNLAPIESPTLPKDQFNPGDWRVWGDDTTGVTYLVYFDGGSFLGLPLQFLGSK